LPTAEKKIRQRHWKLSQLTIETGDGKEKKGHHVDQEQNYEEFLRDLEEDPEMRSQVNLYKAAEAPVSMQTEGTDIEDDFPEVGMDELLDMVDDLTLGGDANEDDE